MTVPCRKGGYARPCGDRGCPVAGLRRVTPVHCYGARPATPLALARVRNDEAQTRRAFLERLAALEQIRSQIYLSGTYVRDFLLAPDSAAAASQASRLAELEHESRAR